MTRIIGSRGGTSTKPQKPENIHESIYVSCGGTSYDNTGDITGVLGNKVNSPTEIMGFLLKKWGYGPPVIQYDSGGTYIDAGFGSFWWAQDVVAANYTNGNYWRFVLSQTEQTTMRELLDRLCSQTPFGIHRKADGTYYMLAYGTGGAGAGSDWNRYFRPSLQVAFHPNIKHPNAVHYGQPYKIWDIKVRQTPREEIYNRFRVKYWQNGFTGELMKSMYVSESEADSNVYNIVNQRNDGKPSALAATCGFNASEACRASQLSNQVTRLMEIELPNVMNHYTAWGVLHYYMKRFLNPRLLVEATCGTEAYDLLPGRIVRFSNDLNLVLAKPDYVNAAYKDIGWLSGDGINFLVTNTKKTAYATGMIVRFLTEQIITKVIEGTWLKTSAEARLGKAGQTTTFGATAEVGRVIKTFSASATLKKTQTFYASARLE